MKEGRLDQLREEARRDGRVSGAGVRASGGPLPGGSSREDHAGAGYHGRPVVKPPPWTWEVPVYFFAGGLAGMVATIALAVLWLHRDSVLAGQGWPAGLVRAALWLATGGSLLSAVLLIMDLGRPGRFLHMLRVCKWRSPMSVGAWTLVGFSTAAAPAALLGESAARQTLGPAWQVPFMAMATAAGLLGLVLATYTGVLVGATAIPAWAAHHRLLPFHFGVVALGSAAAALELVGFRLAPLHTLGLGAAIAETGIAVWLEIGRSTVAGRPLRQGGSGQLHRLAGLLTGPLSLLGRLLGWSGVAAALFLAGALLSRFAWLAVGRASAADPAAALAPRRGGGD
jgi:hypothetical protein